MLGGEEGRLRNSSLAAGCLMAAVLSGSPVSSQPFATQPILLDVAGDATAEIESVLVSAWQPRSGAPVLSATQAGFTAILAAANRPAPSIVVGLIEPGTEASFGIERLLPTTVATFGFEYDDLTARTALRAGNPEVFRQLIAQGFIDPPENVLASAIQTELARMNCYRSSIDGVWGRGSRGAAQAYFDALEAVDPVDAEPEPTTELFRAILLNGDVECATLSPAAAQTSSRTTVSPARSQPSQSTPARSAQPPAPTSTGRSLTTLGTGVFR